MAFYWRPYVPVGFRRHQAAREMERLRKKGHPVSPVVVEGRTIARTFWGQSWCRNLERYSDYSNRLPRGRTYVRNGSVVDLQIARGEITARVSGTSLYIVRIEITPVARARWTALCRGCTGAIDSLVELLQGRLSKAVMERLCAEKTGLFPSPSEIRLSCSCPDWATMCKHVAAVLYGVGARLDTRPDLLFELRGVDQGELIAGAGKGLSLVREGPAAGRVLAEEGLGEMFGIDLADVAPPGPARPRRTPPARAAGAKAAARRKAAPRRAARRVSEPPAAPPPMGRRRTARRGARGSLSRRGRGR